MVWVFGGFFMCFFVVLGFVMVHLPEFGVVVGGVLSFYLIRDGAGRPSPF